MNQGRDVLTHSGQMPDGFGSMAGLGGNQQASGRSGFIERRDRGFPKGQTRLSFKAT
jgi:hypothetical protein